MTEKVGGIEYYIDADAKGVLDASGKVHESTDSMQKGFNKVDKAVSNLIAKQMSLGRTIDDTGKVIGKNGKEVKGATSALKALIAKQNELKASAAQVDAAYKKLNATTNQASKGLGGMGRKAGMAGVQIEQFVGQVQGGGDVMRAFSYQATDLGIVLGAPLVGAAVGLGAALLAVLIPSLGETGDKVKELQEKLVELSETQLLTEKQAKFLAASEVKSAKDRAKEIIKTEEDIASKKESILAMQRNQSKTTLKIYKELEVSIADYKIEVLGLESSLEILNKQQEESKNKLNAYNDATKQTTNQREVIAGVIKSLTEQADSIGKTGRQLLISRLETEKATESDKQLALAKYDLIKADEDAQKTAKLKNANDEKAKLLAEQQAKTMESVLIGYQNQAAQLELNGKAQDEYNARKRLGLSIDGEIPAAIQAEIDKLEDLRIKKAEMSEQDQANRVIEQEFKAIQTEQGGMDDPLKALEEKLLAEREIIKNHLALKLEDEKLSEEQRAELKKNAEDLITDIESKAADARNKLAETEKQAKLSALSGAFSSLSSLMNTESKKLFEIGKAAALAGAIVDGIAAVQGAFKVGSKLGGPPLGAAYGAAAAVQAAVQVQQISKQKIGGASSAGAATSFSGGVPTTNTGGSGGDMGNRNVTVAGINPGDMFSGQQLIDTIRDVVGDGADVSFLTGG